MKGGKQRVPGSGGRDWRDGSGAVVDGQVGVVDGVDELGEAVGFEVGGVSCGEFGDAVMAQCQGDAGIEQSSSGYARTLSDAPDLFHDGGVFRSMPSGDCCAKPSKRPPHRGLLAEWSARLDCANSW